MSDETGDGANYLAALRRSGSARGASAAPAPASEVTASSDAPSAIVGSSTKTIGAIPERRKSPRYKCKGSARMQEIGGVTSTWATLADISMHGCYLESAAPCRVGTRLELKLEANGFRVEAIGEVRVAYPGLGMGISFSEVSDEDRNWLRELVRSACRPSVILGSRIAMTSAPMVQFDVSSVANPTAVLQAILNFFKDRHMMGREEFLRILRKGESSSPSPVHSPQLAVPSSQFFVPGTRYWVLILEQPIPSIGYDEALWRSTLLLVSVGLSDRLWLGSC
ncbi:MAG TPA: PilZ domain-containing protein [Candidatus Eremiobacteraceae bacterium]|nr:PilZ domain-containing protein [Candidatus Eremiobacteraceae bacterium]